MPRVETESRREVVEDEYSILFTDASQQTITATGAANYTTDIISDFTVLALVNLPGRNTAGTNCTIISNNTVSNSTNYSLALNMTTRVLTAIISTGSSNQAVTGTTKVPFGWSWVGLSYKQGGNLSIIINKSMESTAATITAAASAARTLYVSSTNTNGYVNGYVAKVWILGKQLSQGELDEVVETHTVPQGVTPALLWNMVEGSGSSVRDDSGRGNTGTISVASWSTQIPTDSRIDVA